jgi:hypothetical protein
VAPALIARLRVGGEASLFIHHLVRDDTQALFGFARPEELGFFELLMTVTGVGPRLAMAIIGAHPVTRLQMAIVTDDLDVLTSVSGVGRKTAQRIVLELKEKIHAAGLSIIDGRLVLAPNGGVSVLNSLSIGDGIQAVPEPTTLVLLAIGLLLACAPRIRRAKEKTSLEGCVRGGRWTSTIRAGQISRSN